MTASGRTPVIRYVPSRSVTVPEGVPATRTPAPTTGSPEASRTVPVTVRFPCAEAAKESRNKAPERSAAAVLALSERMQVKKKIPDIKINGHITKSWFVSFGRFQLAKCKNKRGSPGKE